MTQTGAILGVVLAGGRSNRFGGEKAAAVFQGRSLLETAVARLRRGCADVAVSAAPGSRAAEIATALGLPVLHDAPGSPPGPLAGVSAGLAWAQGRGAGLLATLPCDLPLAPDDLVARLAEALRPGDGAVVARTADGLHPLCALIRTAVRDPLANQLARGEHPAVHAWLAGIEARELSFEDARAFLNVNVPGDLPRAGA